MIKIKFLGLALLILFSAEINAEHYQMPLRLGEVRDEIYTGKDFPEQKWNNAREAYAPIDDYYNENIFNKRILLESSKLRDFYFYELPNSQMCSVVELNQGHAYMQYLFRLVSISYLFEAIKQNYDMSFKLGEEVAACNVKNDFFKKCRAKSNDMKKFISRAQNKSWGTGRTPMAKLSKLDRESLILELKKRSPLDAGEYFISKSQNSNILHLNNTLSASCTNIKNQIQSLCSEEDNYWGLAKIPLVIELIRTSNAFQIINREGHGLGCLNRFSQTYKSLEKTPFYLANIFDMTFNKLEKDQERYAQGELFVPGSLKEFDEKGLEEFLYVTKSTPVKVVIKEPAPVIEIKTEIKVEAKVEVPVVTHEPIKVMLEKPAAPEIKMSAFSFAVNEKIKKNLKTFFIDMNIFKKDYVFEELQVSKLRPLVEEYQGREALIDMKELDGLGSIKEPVKLKFIKFLIDYHYHQGLFNMVAVLGNQFYVQNDLEAIETPYFIEIRNDETTKNIWQLILTNPPIPKKEEAEAPSPKSK